MTNRQKIMKAAKAVGYEVNSLTFDRIRDFAYGDSWNASYWYLETKCGETFSSDKADTVDDGVEQMIAEMILTKKTEKND